MTLAVAESLLDAGGAIDSDKLIGALAAVQAAEPWRGFDEASTRAAALVRRGVGWQAAARSLDGGRGSLGHGAAARVPPVALIAHHDRDAVRDVARRSAEVTHAHPLGQDTAVLQALAVAEALLSSGGDIDASAAVELLRQRTAHPLLRDRLERVSTLIEEGACTYPVSVRAHAQEAVPAALAIFLRHPDDFGEAICEAIWHGGLGGGVPAMAGTLAGARLGMGASPAGGATGSREPSGSSPRRICSSSSGSYAPDERGTGGGRPSRRFRMSDSRSAHVRGETMMSEIWTRQLDGREWRAELTELEEKTAFADYVLREYVEGPEGRVAVGSERCFSSRASAQMRLLGKGYRRAAVRIR